MRASRQRRLTQRTHRSPRVKATGRHQPISGRRPCETPSRGRRDCIALWLSRNSTASRARKPSTTSRPLPDSSHLEKHEERSTQTTTRPSPSSPTFSQSRTPSSRWSVASTAQASVRWKSSSPLLSWSSKRTMGTHGGVGGTGLSTTQPCKRRAIP